MCGVVVTLKLFKDRSMVVSGFRQVDYRNQQKKNPLIHVIYLLLSFYVVLHPPAIQFLVIWMMCQWMKIDDSSLDGSSGEKNMTEDR